MSLCVCDNITSCYNCVVPIILKCVKLNSIPMGNEPDVSNTFLVFKMSSIHRLCKNIDLARHKFYLNKKTYAIQVFGQDTENWDSDQVVLDGYRVWSL